MSQLRGLEVCNIRSTQIFCFNTVCLEKGTSAKNIWCHYAFFDKRGEQKTWKNHGAIDRTQHIIILRETDGTVSEMPVYILSIIVLYVTHI